jgi:type IV pilus assembly protein PilW
MNARQHSSLAHNYPPVAQRGLSLIELMVALTIGSVLIFGAMQVYVDSRAAYAVNESVARLQETGRYAMAVLEPDIRNANNWGILKAPFAIAGQANQTTDPILALPGGSVANTICGNNFAVDLARNIQGDNNGYIINLQTGARVAGFLSPTVQAGCSTLIDPDTNTAWVSNRVVTADTITVRRAAERCDPAAPCAAGSVLTNQATAGVLQICSERDHGTLASDGTACTAPLVAPPQGQVNDLIVDSYYVDQNSDERPLPLGAGQTALPSLRRKRLTSIGGVIQFQDQEIVAGIEDMQVQFGIDPTYQANPTATIGAPTRYLNPDDAMLAVRNGAQVVAVRIWLLVRADTAEVGFTDNRPVPFQYADRLQATGVTGNLNSLASAGMAYQPALNPDASPVGARHVRRLLVSRTVQLRNALGT